MAREVILWEPRAWCHAKRVIWEANVCCRGMAEGMSKSGPRDGADGVEGKERKGGRPVHARPGPAEAFAPGRDHLASSDRA